MFLLQDAGPVPTPTPGPSGPNAGDIASALLGGLPGAFSSALSDWLKEQVPNILSTLIGGAMTNAASGLVGAVSDVLRATNIITTLPPNLTYQLSAVVQMQNRLRGIGFGGWTACLVWTILVYGGATIAGRPSGLLLAGLGRCVLSFGGLTLAPRLMRSWIDACNAFSTALLDLGNGLPDLGQFKVNSGAQYSAAVLLATFIEQLFALILFLSRVGTVVFVDVLLVIAPLAAVLWAVPFPLASRFGAWWCNQFILACVTQIILAIIIALGISMIAAIGTSGLGDVGQIIMSLMLFAGLLWTAFRLPGKLLHLGDVSPVSIVTTTVRSVARRIL